MESLHNHTTNSDGELTHVDFLKKAEEEGFSVVAFTDHDVLPTSQHVNEVKSFSTKIKWIWGIEISAGAPKDCAVKNFHTTALFVDPFNVDLRNFCEYQKKKRLERMNFIVSNLQRIGFSVTEEECVQCSNGESVGRPHIVKALQRKEGNTAVMNKLIDEYVSACEKNPALKSVAPKCFNPEIELWQKSYDLFLTDTAFYEGVYMDVESPSLQECIRLVHGAGGILVLAHYCVIAKRVAVSEVEGWLKAGYLDGCETLYEDNWAGADTRHPLEIAQLKDMCLRNNKIWFVGGGDIHYKRQFKEYADGDGKRSQGMLEHLLKTLADLGFKINLAACSNIVACIA